MYKILLVSSALALTSLSTNALADGAVTGAAGGAITGAIVGGPVGAAVGGVAGGVAGAVIDPPNEVVTYVEQQPAPPSAVVVQEPIVVGKPLPAAVQVVPVPDNPNYAYTVVNDRHVIVEPSTHRVVKVIE